MNVDPHVIAKLRAMFADGATPSRLVGCLANHFADHPDWPRHVQAYFAAAFSVVVLDMENKPADFRPGEPLALRWNVDLLTEMVGRAHLWRKTNGQSEAARGSWLGGLSVSRDDLAIIDQVEPDAHPSLSQSWPTMTQDARDFVKRCMVNSQAYWERTQVLARLAERLQEEIIELRQQLPVDHGNVA